MLILKFTADDRLCIPVPMYHCFAMVLGTLPCATSGAAVAMARERIAAAMQYQRFSSGRSTRRFGPDFVMRAVS